MSDTSDFDLATALHDVPVFPLPGCVFFPHTLLPLHVFEPRYRAMTQAAIDGNRLIAVVNCDADENIEPVAGVGQIVNHIQHPDGRWHILLRGLARVKVLEELPPGDRLFRRVRAAVLDDVIVDEQMVQDELRTLQQVCTQLYHTCEDAYATVQELTSKVSAPGVLADVICAATLEEGKERQATLADCCVVSRLKRATGAVSDFLLQKTDQSGVVH